MQEGSIYSISRGGQKRFFQYIGKDSCQLYSDVIYIFARKYRIDENPDVAEIWNDSYEYVFHTTISLGRKICGWQYVGKGKTQSIKDVVFATKHSNPLSFKIGDPLDGGWRIWKANEDAVIVPIRPNIKLTNGAVFSPYHIEEILFDVGFDDLYDVHATGEPKRMSVWFQQQEWNDIIEKDFLNKINLTYPELAPEYLFAQANLSEGFGFSNGGIRKIEYAYGTTVATWNTGNKWGITLGSYISGGKEIQANPNNSIFQHEYGHYLQSQEKGTAYLFVDGIPSAINAATHSSNEHNRFSVELDANRRAFLYFHKTIKDFYKTREQFMDELNNRPTLVRGWNFFSNPLFNEYDENLYHDYYFDDMSQYVIYP